MDEFPLDTIANNGTVEKDACEDIRQRYESLLRDNPDAIFEVNLLGVITESNPACEHILGYSQAEFVGMPVRALLSAEPEVTSEGVGSAPEIGGRGSAPDSEVTSQGVAMHLNRVTAGEAVLLHKSGRRVHVRYKCIPIVVQHRPVGTHLVVADITEDKRSIQDLKIAKEELQTIFKTIDVSLWLTEAPFQSVKQISPQTEKIWGVPLDTLINDYSAWYDVIHPDDVDEVTAKMAALDSGHPFKHDYRIVHPNGETRWIHDRVTPIMDDHGEIVRVIGVAMDITSSKLAEAQREQANLMLERSNRLAALGQLAAGVAHEIRNPLTSVAGFIQLLQPLLPDYGEYFDVLTSELKHIHSIVDDFLTVSKPRKAAEPMRLCNLKDIVESTASFLEAQTMLRNISVVIDCHPDLPPVSCVESQLKQVFMNLLRNSMEAMPNGGTINVEVEPYDEREVVVRVVDHGCGIAPELLSRIGEPFLTTKETGTGLGMMVTRQIVESHCGRVFLESEVNQGTTVSVILPLPRV